MSEFISPEAADAFRADYGAYEVVNRQKRMDQAITAYYNDKNKTYAKTGKFVDGQFVEDKPKGESAMKIWEIAVVRKTFNTNGIVISEEVIQNEQVMAETWADAIWIAGVKAASAASASETPPTNAKEISVQVRDFSK